MSKTIALVGLLIRRSSLLFAGFLVGFIFREADLEVRFKLEELISNSGITPELVALVFPLISEYFSMLHNKRLSNGV